MKWLVVHDFDLHGFTSGVVAVRALLDLGAEVTVYSNFEPKKGLPSSTPPALGDVIQSRASGADALAVLDIPVGREPAAVRALTGFAGKVVVADHHEWKPALLKRLQSRGLAVMPAKTAYGMTLAFPRHLGLEPDGFAEKWALVGAVSDFDRSVADRVSRDFEEAVCDYLDRAFKLNTHALPRGPEEYGDCGSRAYAVAESRLEPSELIERAKATVGPLPLPRHEVVGAVALATEVAEPGSPWKVAWKLSLATGSPMAVVPATDPARGQYGVVVSVYWREPDHVAASVDSLLKSRAGYRLFGSPGARVVAGMKSATEAVEAARYLADLVNAALKS